MWNARFSMCAASLKILLLLLVIYAFLFTPTSYATVINVPEEYPTIGEAITAASAGDTINVNRRAGESQSVYYEHIVINKQLTLIGESRDTIIIDGNGTGTVVTIQADSVEFEGFTVRNAGMKYSGLRANSYSYAVITDNTFKTHKYGIVLLSSIENTIAGNILFNNSAAGISISDSVDNSVSGNDVSESAYGIKLSVTNTTLVSGNTLSDNSYGIYIEYSRNNTVADNILQRNIVEGILPSYSSEITIRNNSVAESAYGIQLYESNEVTVLANTITENGYSIYLLGSSLSNTIENNTITNSDWGITLYNSSSNTLKGNTISQNTYGIKPTQNSNNNLIYHNNLINNTEQAAWNPYCTNTWDNGYPSGGNHWSDYPGTDQKNGPNQDQPGSDGIGDTQYTIDPTNRDRYPLMTPWGFFHDVAIINVAVSATKAYIGETVNITVTAENQGTYTETFNVTAKYENTTLAILETVGTQEVTNMAPTENIILTFSWNTTDAQPCVNCTIKAEASTVPGESDTTDNLFTDGTVKIKLVGDVNGDGAVDVSDMTIVSIAYGNFEGEPGYNPEADLNKDGIVDMRDLATVARNLGKTC